MGRGLLNEKELEIIRKNPYVSDADESRIIYTNEFKHLFMKEYNSGKKPSQIFREAGLPPEILGSKRIERACFRWRESYAAGTLGVYQDGTIRKRNTEQNKHFQCNSDYYLEKLNSIEEKYVNELQKQQAQINLLKQEIEEIKKTALA